MKRGGCGKYGDGENTGIIIPRPKARTYTTAMTVVSRFSLSSSVSSSSGGVDCGDNSDDSDDNDDAYAVVVCHSLLQRMSENISEGGVGRVVVVRRGRGYRGDNNDRDDRDLLSMAGWGGSIGGDPVILRQQKL